MVMTSQPDHIAPAGCHTARAFLLLFVGIFQFLRWKDSR